MEIEGDEETAGPFVIALVEHQEDARTAALWLAARILLRGAVDSRAGSPHDGAGWSTSMRSPAGGYVTPARPVR